MSALKEYRDYLRNDSYRTLSILIRLDIDQEKQDRLLGGKAEVEMVCQQRELIRRYREIQRQRIKLVEDRIDEIESQQQDAAAGH